MLAVDVSNYTDPLTPEALAGFRTAGVEHAIVQAIDPPAGYPTGRTRDQVQACLSAGLTVDAYVWQWFDLDVADIGRKLALLEGLPIRRIWLDVEDTASIKYDLLTCETKVAAALAACDAFPTTSGRPTGIYTGRWFWADRRYMANTIAFAARDLWDSNYDRQPNTAVNFTEYGGWKRAAIKQYQGTSTLAGIGNLDLDVLSVEESAAVAAQEDEVRIPADVVAKFHLANDQDVQGLIDNYEGVITTVRQIAFAAGEAEHADAEAKVEQIRQILGTAAA